MPEPALVLCAAGVALAILGIITAAVWIIGRDG